MREYKRPIVFWGNGAYKYINSGKIESIEFRYLKKDLDIEWTASFT